MVTKKMFDIHVEIGSVGTRYYAKTIIGASQILFWSEGDTPSKAIAKLAGRMENASMWSILFNKPSLSVYPFSSQTQAPTSGSATKTKIDPNAPKHKPGDLTAIKFPDCKPQCTSYDFFGAGKCKGMCAHKKGI